MCLQKKKKGQLLRPQGSDSQSVFPGPSISAPPRNVLQLYIFKLYPRPTELEILAVALRQVSVMLMENQCHRASTPFSFSYLSSHLFNYQNNCLVNKNDDTCMARVLSLNVVQISVLGMPKLLAHTLMQESAASPALCHSLLWSSKPQSSSAYVQNLLKVSLLFWLSQL